MKSDSSDDLFSYFTSYFSRSPRPKKRAGFASARIILWIAGAVISASVVFIFVRYFSTTATGLKKSNSGILGHAAHVVTSALADMFGSGGTKPVAIISLSDTAATDEMRQFVSAPSSSQSISTAYVSNVKKKKTTTKSKTVALENSKDEGIIVTDTNTTSSFAKTNMTSSKSTTVKKSSAKSAEVPECGFYSAASPSHTVVINEIAWMGSVPRAYESSTLATGNEWIEFKNVSGKELDVSGWRLMNQSGKVDVAFNGVVKVAPEGLLLLERTDDDTIPWIKADKIYSGGLSNSGDWLALYDASCNKVDEVNMLSGWTAGDNATKRTMERGGDFLWHTSVSPGGTPKLENTGGVSMNSGGGGSANSPQVGSTSSPQAGSGNTYITGGGTSASPSASSTQPASSTRVVLLITEVQTASASSTHDEWVEIYNPGSTDIMLTGWYIQKHTKSASSSFTTFAPKDLFASSTIKALGYLVIAHPSATIPFDVSTDYGIADDNALALKNPEGDIVDLLGWGDVDSTSSPQGDRCEGACAPNASSGVSLARKYDGGAYMDTNDNSFDFFLSLISTPGSASVFPTSAATSSTPSSTLLMDNSTSTATSTIPVATSTPPVADTTSTTSTSFSTNTLSHIVIFEVQTTGGPGNTTNDYIKLLNPTSSTIDISNWKLRKRTTSGAESSVKVFPGGSSIFSNGYFVWANSANGFADSIGANVSSTATIADDTSIALEDSSGAVVDALAWGSGQTNPFVEGTGFSQNPDVSQKLVRKTDPLTGFVIDSDDNSADFEIR